MTFWFIYTLVLRVYSQSVILAGTSKIYLTMVMLERWIQHSLETRTETVRNYFSRSSSLIRIDNRITCKSSKSVKYNSQTAHNALVQTPRFQIWLVDGHHTFKSNSDWLGFLTNHVQASSVTFCRFVDFNEYLEFRWNLDWLEGLHKSVIWYISVLILNRPFQIN